MKLSDIRGEAALDCVEAMLELAGAIVEDDSIMAALTGDGKATRKALDVARAMLSERYRGITVKVLAALSGKTVEEYLEDTSLPQMVGDVYGAITDAELLSFLSPQEIVPGTISGDTLGGSGQTS